MPFRNVPLVLPRSSTVARPPLMTICACSRETLAAWFSPGTGDRSFLDLERANREQLRAAGVSPDAIFGAGLCTKTHLARLHSYRGDRERAGRMVGAIRAV